MTYLNEDTLVQQTTTDYLKSNLGWDSVYAYNQETFGPDRKIKRGHTYLMTKNGFPIKSEMTK